MRMKIFILLFLFSYINFGWSVVISVCKNGCKFNSIQEAINAAIPYSKIMVYPGIYNENLLINKPLELIGKNFPVIDAGHKGDVVKSTSGDVKIEGFVIENSGRSDIEDFAGIKFLAPDSVGNGYGIKNCVIKSNKILNNFFGIWMGNSTGCKIEDNQIIGPAVQSEVNSGNGIHLWHCKDIIIKHNLIKGHRDGIYFEFTSHSYIINNISEDNFRYGIHFMYSSYDTYLYNTFNNNQTGGAVMYSKYVTMEYNKFIDAWGPVSWGLLLKTMDHCYIYRNIFRRDTTAIVEDEGTNSQFIENNFINNGSAINLHQGNSLNNLFKNNNFISNTFDVVTGSSINNNNIFEYNYWSDYTGYDLDKDGIGDVPFRPVKLMSLFSQNFPASLILLKSFFIQLLDYAQDVIPTLTPDTLVDNYPRMEYVRWKVK